MSSRTALAVATAAAFALTAAPAHAASDDPDPSAWTTLSTTYQATSKYGYEASAPGGGYARGNTCVADRAEGGAGYHYLDTENIGSLDPAKPAALLYADGSDFVEGRRLVGVEWVVKDTGQKVPPTLFGQHFQKNPKVPGVFTLHAWIYKPNPKGLFAPWNPDVVCPAV